MTQPYALFLADVLEDAGKPADIAEKCAAELRRLHAELERERMRLVACGVVALADTPDSAKHARQMHPDYQSASCQDVARRVDECISLRAQRDALLKALKLIVKFVDAPTEGKRPDVFVMRISKARAAIAKAEENV